MASTKHKIQEPEESTDEQESSEEEYVPKQRVFLYFQLQNVTNLPKVKGKLKLELTQAKNTITKLEDHFTTDTSIDLSKFPEYKPTLSVAIEQDNIEDINIFSDNPLLLTIYEYGRKHLYGSSDTVVITDLTQTIEYLDSTKETNLTVPVESVKTDKQSIKLLVGSTRPTVSTAEATTTESMKSTELNESEPTEEEPSVESEYIEYVTPIAQAHIDLLKYFTKRREVSTLSCFVQPLRRNLMVTEDGTICTEWQVYSLLPLLKEVYFCNMCYLTLESIYNVRPEIMQKSDKLVAAISFQSNIPDKNKEYQKLELCTYSNLFTDDVCETNIHFTWETLRSKDLFNYDCLGIRCGTVLSADEILLKLVRPEKCDIDPASSKCFENPKLKIDSTHRYILTENLVRILEEALLFKEQRMILELYDIEEPEEILMRGEIDLNILLYPKVNVARIVVQLESASPKAKPNIGKTPPGPKRRTGSVPENIEPMFAIVNICLATPITEVSVPQSAKLPPTPSSRHKQQSIPKSRRAETVIQGPNAIETYTSFNETVREIVNTIIGNDIKSQEEVPKLLCCQKQNLENKILALVASDFNIRFPTNNTREFHDLMTVVFEELMNRVYSMVNNCDDAMLKALLTNAEIETRIVHLFSSMKYMDELGETELAEILLDKAASIEKKNLSLPFFELIYNLEKLNFSAAKEYFKRADSEKYGFDNVLSIMEIYILYIEILENEETFNAALEYLLDALRDFLSTNTTEISIWILLYCLYRRCGYAPGIAYTRWMYEMLFATEEIKIPLIPNSRWEIFVPYKLQLPNSERNEFFLRAYKEMNRLGLYKFGRFIFQEISSLCTPLDNYMIQTIYNVILGEMPKKYPVKFFPNTKGKKQEEILLERAFQASVNGHLEYSRDAKDAAVKHYKSILHIDGMHEYHFFSLGILRLAYKLRESENHLEAADAFARCYNHNVVSLQAFLGAGKSLYDMDNLDDAESCFSKCTEYALHIPDVWGYLALINLRQNRNFRALECWKYAKLNEKFEVSEELKEKLNEINFDDLLLFVDVSEQDCK